MCWPFQIKRNQKPQENKPTGKKAENFKLNRVTRHNHKQARSAVRMITGMLPAVTEYNSSSSHFVL